MSVYGKDFARIYNQHYISWTRDKAWPFLSDLITRQAPDARTWLDLCCGPGWLLKFASKEAYETFGVDASRHQLRWARKNAPKAKLLCADIRSFSLARKVDVITCMFDSLNYLTRKNDLLQALRNARRHLDADGLFIFDMNTFEGLEDTWRHTSVMHEKDWTSVYTSSFGPAKALGTVEITGFVRQGKLYRKFVERHVERGYHAAEIDDLLRRARFRFRKYDARNMGRPKKRSPRLMYVCRRAKT
jgi:SAM-dependent methyltransferase